MKNFIFFTAAITILILIGGVFISSVKKEGGSVPTLAAPTSYEYFWSASCPHCAKVAEFMDSWPGKDKINIEKFEVNDSAENSKRFVSRGQYCKIPKTQMGVPLLITPDGKCLNGDEPIIEYLKNLES